MRLEPRGRTSTALSVIDGEIQPFAVDDVPPGRQRAEIVRPREVEGGGKARVQMTIPIALLERVQDHREVTSKRASAHVARRTSHALPHE